MIKTKCSKDPSHAIFLKGWEFQDIRYGAYNDKDNDQEKDNDNDNDNDNDKDKDEILYLWFCECSSAVGGVQCELEPAVEGPRM